MEKAQIDILAKNSGKTSRTVFRAIKELELTSHQTLSKDILNLIVVYLRIDGAQKSEIRQTLKIQIALLLAPKVATTFDPEFKQYLISQSKQKDKQLKRKEKQIIKYSEAIVGLSGNLLKLVDDISMLRVQDTGTIQRLYDKNVLGDLLTDLKAGSPEHTAVQLLLQKVNQTN